MKGSLRKTANLRTCIGMQILFSKKSFLLFYDSFGCLVEEKNELLEICDDLQCFFIQPSSKVIASFFYFLNPGIFIISIDHLKTFYELQSRFQNFFLVGILYWKSFLNLHAFYTQPYFLLNLFERDFLMIAIVQKKFLHFLFLLKIYMVLIVSNGVSIFLNYYDSYKNL